MGKLQGKYNELPAWSACVNILTISLSVTEVKLIGTPSDCNINGKLHVDNDKTL
jgi:hypothetical protein